MSMESETGDAREGPQRPDFDRAIDLFEGLDEEPAAERPPEPKPRPERRRRNVLRGETARRILVAIPWIGFAIAITVAGGLPFTVAVTLLALVCVRELFVMTSELRPIQVAAYVALVAMIAAAHFGDAFQILLALAATFPLLFFFGAERKHREGVTVSVGITLLAIVWIGLPFVHAVLLRGLPDHGAALLIDVLVGTFAADTGAYATGRMFGSHRIAPSLSPNKTLEGLLGGFLIGTMGFWFAGLYQDWMSGIDALLIGAAVAAVAPIGDLFASLIKRDLDRKDTGRLFGPHGGLLDRLDAVLFTVVVGYYLSLQLVY
jgi:phosphatidate cytidylyltransferase